MASVDLWKTSGHFDFYADGMFDQMEVEGAEYQLKPMNCPFHVLVYKDELRSYRELLSDGASWALSTVTSGRAPCRASSACHPGRRPHLLPPRAARR